jgi:hypothetical protein
MHPISMSRYQGTKNGALTHANDFLQSAYGSADELRLACKKSLSKCAKFPTPDAVLSVRFASSGRIVCY